MKLYSKIALRNLWKSKRRTFTTGAAIMFGFAGLCLLGGYILRVEKTLKVTSVYINHTGHVSIFKKDALESFVKSPRKYHLTGEDLSKINEVVKTESDVEFTAPILKGMGLISNGQKSVPFIAFGIEPTDEKKIQEHPQVKKWVHELIPQDGELSIKDATGDLANTISITKELGTLIGKSPPFSNLSPTEKDVQLAGRTYEGDLNAINASLGFKHSTGYSLTEDTGLMAPIKLLREIYDTEGATYLAVYLNPDASISHFVNTIQKKFKDAGLNYEAFPFNDDRISLFYVGTMGFLYIMAGFFVFLIFSAVALSIVNSMTIGLFERVREIGTLRAMGFNHDQTAFLLTLESFYLSIISLGLGYVVTQLAARLINSLNIRFNPPGIVGDMQFVLTPDTWFCIALAVPILLICVLCSYLVSRSLIRKPVVDLLQHAS
jgi:putative ABC transport system permease protein